MNIFKKFFSKNGNGSNDTEALTNDSLITESNFNDPAFKEMFIDEDISVNEEAVQNVNSLKEFFQQNFIKIGYTAGYDNHSAQSIENGIKNIQSEYKLNINKMIGEYDNEVYFLEINKIKTEGISDSLINMFDLKIQQYRELIEKCKKELEFSEDLKGHIEYAVNKYKEGFEKGMTQYFEEKHFGSSTGLFN